jgi:hypothetical protein
MGIILSPMLSRPRLVVNPPGHCQLVGQVEIKGETDFNNLRSDRCICPSKSIRRKVRG